MNRGLRVRALPLLLTSNVMFFPTSMFMLRSTLAFRIMSSESLIATSLPFLATISPLTVCPGTRERIWRLMLSAWAGVIWVRPSERTSPENSCVSFMLYLPPALGLKLCFSGVTFRQGRRESFCGVWGWDHIFPVRPYAPCFHNPCWRQNHTPGTVYHTPASSCPW